jgi:hypothetical protein
LAEKMKRSIVLKRIIRMRNQDVSRGETSERRMGKSLRLCPQDMFLVLELTPPHLARIEETFLPWLDRTVDTILPLLTPRATPFEPYSRTDLPPPLYHLRFLEDAPEGSNSVAQMNEESDALEPGWKWAKLRRNTRVTDVDWWQDVREIDLDLEDSDQ